VLWSGLIVSAVGTWMQIVALSLLVLQLKHGSAIALGEVSLTQAVAFFAFAPVGGGIADRFDRRSLLLGTQSLLMVLAFLLGLATYTGVIRFWMIVVISFCSASVLSVDQPARFALLPSLVPAEDLMNALSLQSVVFNGASMLGPALAGVAANCVGLAGNFFLNAASFLAVLVSLSILRVTNEPGMASGQRRGSLFFSVGEALRAVRADVVLPTIILVYGALLLAGPSSALLLPVFATKVLGVGARGLGLLFSALGSGTIVGSLVIASLGDYPQKHRLLWIGYAIWIAALAAFSFSSSLWFAMVTLLLLGAAQNGLSATTVTLMQTRVPPQMRGRVMSLNTMLLMGVRPLGDFPTSALIWLIGVQYTALAAACLVGLGCFYSFVFRRGIRRIPY
jgi:MFS family permease